MQTYNPLQQVQGYGLNHAVKHFLFMTSAPTSYNRNKSIRQVLS